MQTSLYFTQGSSDKEYHVQLREVPQGSLYTVDFQYGRRGGPLQTGTKTSEPLTFEKAKKVYDKLVAEKVGKGYVTGDDGVPYQNLPEGKAPSGLLPQLLNAIDEATMKDCLGNSEWIAQEKHDGERLMVKVQETDATVIGSNRKGLVRAIPQALAFDLSQLPGGTVVDGELVGDHFYVFDLLQAGSKDMRNQTYLNRYEALVLLLSRIAGENVTIVTTALTTQQKTDLLEEVRARNGEGVVLKRGQSIYSAGRPNSLGDQLKYKFYETATFEVDGNNADRRSVSLRLYQDGMPVAVGNVTIPPSKEIPKPGTVVEVRYLYAYQGGSIYQPSFLNQRADQDASDCLVSQLKYKAAA